MQVKTYSGVVTKEYLEELPSESTNRPWVSLVEAIELL